MYLKSLKLKNVRGFSELNFDFERPNGTYAGWTVIVGGNASGKSTVLKAIALLMVGTDSGRQLLGPIEGWIRRKNPGASKTSRTRSASKPAELRGLLSFDPEMDKFQKGGNTPRGELRVSLDFHQDSDSEIVELREGPGDKRGREQSAQRGPWGNGSKGWFCAGYGPMRRLARSSADAARLSARSDAPGRFVTLFREDASLAESEAWLKTLHSRRLEARARESGRSRSKLKKNRSKSGRLFDVDQPDESDEIEDSKSTKEDIIIENVKSIMNDGLLPHGFKISEITVDHVYVRDETGVELPLRDVSDGCRGIYATILDLIHHVVERCGPENTFGRSEAGSSFVAVPGVVLVDEIEAHLHPSWQRTIPEWLTAHFPKIQFIVTTHSPLIAQSANSGGLFVLPSIEDKDRVPRRLSEAEIDKIRLGQAEKTLYGVAFGLSTSRTNWALRQIQRWQALNAKAVSGVKLSLSEAKEHKELKEQMNLAFEESQEMTASA